MSLKKIRGKSRSMKESSKETKVQGIDSGLHIYANCSPAVTNGMKEIQKKIVSPNQSLSISTDHIIYRIMKMSREI